MPFDDRIYCLARSDEQNLSTHANSMTASSCASVILFDEVSQNYINFTDNLLPIVLCDICGIDIICSPSYKYPQMAVSPISLSPPSIANSFPNAAYEMGFPDLAYSNTHDSRTTYSSRISRSSTLSLDSHHVPVSLHRKIKSAGAILEPSLYIRSGPTLASSSSTSILSNSSSLGENNCPLSSMDDTWNLVPYSTPWESTQAGHRESLFLKSPTPLKNQRTGQACENCREQKAKCSGTHPSCARCISRGSVCVYSDNHNHKKRDVNRRNTGPSSTSKAESSTASFPTRHETFDASEAHIKKESDMHSAYPRSKSASFSPISLGSADPDASSVVSIRRHRDTSDLYRGWTSNNTVSSSYAPRSGDVVSTVGIAQQHTMPDYQNYYPSPNHGHTQSSMGNLTYDSSPQTSRYYELAQSGVQTMHSNYEPLQQLSYPSIDGQPRAISESQGAINISESLRFGGQLEYDSRNPAAFGYGNDSYMVQDMATFENSDVHATYHNHSFS